MMKRKKIIKMKVLALRVIINALSKMMKINQSLIPYNNYFRLYLFINDNSNYYKCIIIKLNNYFFY